VTVGFGISDGMLAAEMERVVPSSHMTRYCGDEAGSRGVSITVPEWVCPEVEYTSNTCVTGGYGLLIAGLSSR
jgi:hypothetical protein